jgi:hypothetical protein
MLGETPYAHKYDFPMRVSVKTIGARRPAVTRLRASEWYEAPRVRRIWKWLDKLDPGAGGRLKGLRLVAVYAVAAFLGRVCDVVAPLSSGMSVATLAAGFALWASIAEARTERISGTRDLIVLCVAATVGAIVYYHLAQWLSHYPKVGPEASLVTAAFLVAYLKRFGTLGAAIGSQIYIGQLLAFGADAQPADLAPICLAGGVATLAAIGPRCLIYRAGAVDAAAAHIETSLPPSQLTALLHGIQTATAALVVVILNSLFVLTESAWAITACVFVITATLGETVQRARHRVCGTLVGVPLGLLCMPIAAHDPVVTWILAAVAMIVFTIALKSRYDIACGAFAFVLIVTLEISGQRSVSLLLARIWETMLGAVLGVAIALLAWFSLNRISRKRQSGMAMSQG